MISICKNICMSSPSASEGKGKAASSPSAAAFLLAQLGSHAASKFAGHLTELKLVPAHAGILRILSQTPAITQQALARKLGTVPSRLVGLLDDVEGRGLIERRMNRDDRRRHAVYLTNEGRATLRKIGELSRGHQRTLFTALSEEEQEQLAALLQRVADEQGLTRDVHPGYRTLGGHTPGKGGRRKRR